MQIPTVGSIYKPLAWRQQPPCGIHANWRSEVKITRVHHIIDVLKIKTKRYNAGEIMHQQVVITAVQRILPKCLQYTLNHLL